MVQVLTGRGSDLRQRRRAQREHIWEVKGREGFWVDVITGLNGVMRLGGENGPWERSAGGSGLTARP